ncbi:formate dehydrogenase accessory sulfurtransferase FdhD [Agrobacterium fabrum]|jgi:FdhD protein|uniref:formate dehydrogenase accessory sulfurtransferase FdhD n=1 Tax=Agrobacterium fabrum TaxID=1176649 RepID=UPI0009B980B8|nr:formate dehydrogenase accessory sulfurtransferase FdhD [Agrobacterium fabrum]MCR6723969.1 formate dehydrogenase accessory sulfurtransferase FdhD [Agrobacterium fabrum]WCK75893.1 formate dehydrogenase accessory sulfurtransferase FdhD [Agrobacterium fabrum]WIE26988.1 formate dehydrogenase accessory sulfurtransferase FdhD [Agrobacterium fabrum]WIE42945.1 formate dehydrogenase accessory sulfurtransferase FdhD [Agrobacterium fabrum]CUX33036.1 formate dehydrogenase formation protein, subunit FdhD
MIVVSVEASYRKVARTALRGGTLATGGRAVPEEVPVAFSYGGSTHAVMMASPADLIDFAVGFSLTEGIISMRSEIQAIEVVEAGQGYDVQVDLTDAEADALRARRRHMAGPVGCGLCGIESIEQAVRVVPDLSGVKSSVHGNDIIAAVKALNEAQTLNRETRAVHGAGFYSPREGLLAAREDVGRHNALDKLAGAVVNAGISAQTGIVAVTSRLSVEMVQKTAILGCPVLAAISAPTALAIETADRAGITLVALVRGEDFEIFTRADRIIL